MGTIFITIFLICVLFLNGTSGFSNGAPWDTCLTMFPKHGQQRLQTPCPFTISSNKTNYFSNDVITVSLSSNSSLTTFKGLQIRAHPVNGDTEQIVGQFLDWPADKTQKLDCLGGKQNMVTHANSEPVSEVILTWRAPNESYGDIVFVVTFVQDFLHFWIDQRHEITASDMVTLPPVEQVSPTVSVIDWSACGEQKGCFLYPKTCSGYDCYAAVTYRTVNQSTEFEMFGSQSGYVSVGFSEDKKMGHDETVACTSGDLNIGLQRGFNHEELYNERQYRDGLSKLEGQYVDGRLYCRFTRPLSMFLYTEEGHVSRKYVDLNHDHYLMLAWGPISDGSEVMNIHKELPPITHSKVDIREHTIVRGSSLPLTYQMHGTLMLVAWMLMVGIVTVIARYFKASGFGSKTIKGVNAWFQIHRTLAITLWLFTVASFVLIFVVKEGLSETAGPHHYLGISVMTASTLQMLAGLLRPGQDSGFRTVFNIGHWVLGKLTHIVAAVTFYYAFDQEIIPQPQRRFAFIVLSVWLGLQVFWEIWFEVNQRCYSKGHHESYKLSRLDKANGGKPYPHPDSNKTEGAAGPGLTKWLLLYIGCLSAISAAALCSIFLF